MTRWLTILAGVAAVLLGVQSCVYHTLDVTDDPITDQDLFNEINTAGYTYFQNGDLLMAANESPHGSFKLRFNDIASRALNAMGELPANGNFPKGSVVVKEVYVQNTLTVYAVMKKGTQDPNAAEGWLWAEYAPDGTALFGITKKGTACTSCHSTPPHRDLVRSFDLHK